MQIVDFILVLAIVFTIYKFLKKTEGFKIAIAIFVIYVLNYLSFAFGLQYTTDILNKVVDFLVLASVMIFYPEIRMFLKRLTGFKGPKKPTNEILHSIKDAVFEMSKTKTGALIILDDTGHIAKVADSGNYIDAKVNSRLIQTIFNPATVMHDGAILITNGRIKFTGCKLPLNATKKRDAFGTLGTRHLVAIETAENFDVIIFVVSEETGAIKIATKNGFQFISSEEEFYKTFK
jgi:diadenylate cyclase